MLTDRQDSNFVILGHGECCSQSHCGQSSMSLSKGVTIPHPDLQPVRMTHIAQQWRTNITVIKSKALQSPHTP